MRRSQVSDLLTVAAILLFFLGALGAWLLQSWLAQLTHQNVLWTMGALLLLLISSSAYWLHRFFCIYYLQMQALADEAHLMLHTNPDRRALLQGPRALRALTTTVNHFADRFQHLQREQAVLVRAARAELEEEHSLLSAILAESTDSVIVCDLDGRILLYNQQARHLFNPAFLPIKQATERGLEPDRGLLGLGRSIFGLLDRNAIAYGLAHLQSRFVQSDALSSAHEQSIGFITAAANGVLLRIRMAPLLAPSDQLTGFVLNLRDITADMRMSNRRDALLQQLTERFRGGLANIRVAIETLNQFPTMSTLQAERFKQLVQEESIALSSELDQTMRNFADELHAQWRYETMHAIDLLQAIVHYLAQSNAITVESSTPLDELWLQVDHYAIVHGLATTVRDLQQTFAINTIHLTLQPPSLPSDSAVTQQRFAALDLRWPDHQVTAESWLAWQEQILVVDAGDATITLREVAERHGSEVWFQQDPATKERYFRLLLPLAPARPFTPDRVLQPAQTAGVSRPEYYDFDLFRQVAHSVTVTERRLTELTYTAFDTETTGLDPAVDRIVAIGAIRILNGRLLRQEIFDQLVDPQRPISAAAEVVHGIRDSMVRGQPKIEQVLPHFIRFAEETVLVGHNVAFDLRMVEFATTAADFTLTNPVLDTLLLSAVIHPDGDSHTLEAIADRLGVMVIGRHTALGDTIMTAEIFLRMIPLLNAMGIHTLGEAIHAAQQSYFARLNY